MAGNIARDVFRSAVEAFSERGELFRSIFDDLSAAAKQRAFTMARVRDAEVLGDVHDAVVGVLESGGTWRDFRSDLDDIMAARGWTGTDPWHARLVYSQNMQSAYSAGRWQQAADAGVERWRYLPSDAMSPREEHREYYGKVYNLGSGPMPPLDYGCQCGWEVVFEDEAEGEGEQFPAFVAPSGYTFQPSEFFAPINSSTIDLTPEMRRVLLESVARAGGRAMPLG